MTRSRKLTIPLSHDKPVAEELKLIATSKQEKLSNSKPISKGSKENASAEAKQPPPKALPKYSYKDYKPSPARVYVRHIDEADDLVGALSGYVQQLAPSL